MKKIITLAVVTALSSLVAISPANAQESKSSGVSVRAGLFFPSATNASNVGKNWFGFGLEYKLGDLNMGAQKGSNASYSVSIDMFSKGDFRNAPLLLNYISRTENIYYKAGAGVSFLKYPIGGGTESKTDFGYQLAIGYDFNKGNMPYFAEVVWFGSSKSEVNGLALMGGVRF